MNGYYKKQPRKFRNFGPKPMGGVAADLLPTALKLLHTAKR